jgi:fumarate reductase subunit D
MIGLSVAVGRFVEALFWGIFRVAGAVAGALILGVVVLTVAWLVARKIWARRKQ